MTDRKKHDLERLGINVSRETLTALETYETLLYKWQKAINLVSQKSLPEAWQRHFLDSAQLFPHVPHSTKILYDLGSGAGFPGLVLAALGVEGVCLVESDQRKAGFLKNVSRETSVPVTLYNERIEKIASSDDQNYPVPDVITARALAPLEKLLGYVFPWCEQNPDLLLLFLKGEKAEDEISAARKIFDFDLKIIPSQVAAGHDKMSQLENSGVILRITNVKKQP